MTLSETEENQIERWVKHIKKNKGWRKEFNQFINSQFEISDRFYKKLAQTPEGREKIKKLKKLKE